MLSPLSYEGGECLCRSDPTSRAFKLVPFGFRRDSRSGQASPFLPRPDRHFAQGVQLVVGVGQMHERVDRHDRQPEWPVRRALANIGLVELDALAQTGRSQSLAR